MATMEQSSDQEKPGSVIVIMGATGTGKSTFINLLTNDDNIHVGHNQESETFGVQSAHYIDQKTGCSVTLVDTPGFDDSREGVTDTDILEKIVRFFEPQSGKKTNVNGIIYMHRISDPRVGGGSRKNIKLFHALCGDAILGNVRIVTTNWGRVTEGEGDHREADLKSGAFKALIDAGAQMRRHANTLESARQIMGELTPLAAVTMKIQEEVRAGKKLSDTAAGMVLTAEMREVQKKHERELADLKKEMNDAEENENRALMAELEQERKILDDKVKRANADRKRLEATLGVGLGVERSGTSEKFVSLHERSKEAPKAPRAALQARRENSMRLEQQPAVPLGNKTRATTYQGQELDTIAKDEVDQMQVLAEELARGRQARLQQVEDNRVRTRVSQDADRQLERTEAHLRRLEAEIAFEERKKRERAQRSVRKQLADGWRYVSATLTGSGRSPDACDSKHSGSW